VVQSQLVLRRAFALVVASFHARPPEQPGWPHGCRVCDAPLPLGDETPLVICSYCRADNVLLGALLPHTVQRTKEQRLSLDALLAARTRARRRWRIAFAVSLVLILGGGRQIFDTLVRVRAAHQTRHAPVDRRWSYEPAWVRAAR
jgi:hypothetical protein